MKFGSPAPSPQVQGEVFVEEMALNAISHFPEETRSGAAKLTPQDFSNKKRSAVFTALRELIDEKKQPTDIAILKKFNGKSPILPSELAALTSGDTARAALRAFPDSVEYLLEKRRKKEELSTFRRIEDMCKRRDVAGVMAEVAGLEATAAPARDHIVRGHDFLDIEAVGQRAIEYVIDGAIQAGLVVLAAATGLGKTTSLVPLLARVAWLVPFCPLKPKIMRRIIYVTEDSHQVILILRAMVEAGVIAHREELKDRFKVLDATRMPPLQWAEIIETYSKYKAPTTHNSITIEAAPLVVLDTKSAVLELEEENSNGENSMAIATIRQRAKCPVLIVTHVAKAQRGQDASLLSARGADSQVADAQQLLTMSQDPLNPGSRWLEIASQKHRFLAAYDGISFNLMTVNCEVQDAFGQTVIETVAYAHPTPVLIGGRDKARRDSEALAQDDKALAVKRDILNAVEQLVAEGRATSKSAIHSFAGGRRVDVFRVIDEMVGAGELVAVNASAAGVKAAKIGQVIYNRNPGHSVPDDDEREPWAIHQTLGSQTIGSL